MSGEYNLQQHSPKAPERSKVRNGFLMFPGRRDEGIPPYRYFIGWQRIIKSSVGNGLDRSETLWCMP